MAVVVAVPVAAREALARVAVGVIQARGGDGRGAATRARMATAKATGAVTATLASCTSRLCFRGNMDRDQNNLDKNKIAQGVIFVLDVGDLSRRFMCVAVSWLFFCFGCC